MGNIYNYLKLAWQKESHDFRQNPLPYFVLLVVLTIPLPHIFSSIAAILWVVLALFLRKKGTPKWNPALIWPLLLYVGLALSYCWSIAPSLTLSALTKQIPLLLFPLVFFIHSQWTPETETKIKNGLAYGYSVFAFFWLLKALIRYCLTGDQNVFFYHDLVTHDVNAIHVSLYVAVAFFIVLEKQVRTLLEWIFMGVLGLVMVLLSSKNVIIIFLGLFVIRWIQQYRHRVPFRVKMLLGGISIGLLLLFSGKIMDRFRLEVASNTGHETVNRTIGDATNKVYNVTVHQAWNQPTFKANDFFPGTALRVYQIRIFLEMMGEDGQWLTGYGANATDEKIRQKRIEHQLYQGYDVFNFHNQYIQFFAEIGIIGFIICIIMVFVNLKIAINRKDFVHFSFAILIISLFLTESFLARQRGVIYFTLMYCLFTSFSPKGKIKKLL